MGQHNSLNHTACFLRRTAREAAASTHRSARTSCHSACTLPCDPLPLRRRSRGNGLRTVILAQFSRNQLVSQYVLLGGFRLQLCLILDLLLFCALCLCHRPAVAIIKIFAGINGIILDLLSDLDAEVLQLGLTTLVTSLLSLEQSELTRKLHRVALLIID